MALADNQFSQKFVIL